MSDTTPTEAEATVLRTLFGKAAEPEPVVAPDLKTGCIVPHEGQYFAPGPVPDADASEFVRELFYGRFLNY